MTDGPDPQPPDIDPTYFMDPLTSTHLAFEQAISQLPLPYVTARQRAATGEITFDEGNFVQAVVCTSRYERSGSDETTESEDIYIMVMRDGEMYTTGSINDDFANTAPSDPESLEERQLAKRYFSEAVAGASGDTAQWLGNVSAGLEEPNLFRGLVIDMLFETCPGSKEQKQERWGSFNFENGTIVMASMEIPYDHQLTDTTFLQADAFNIVVKENSGRRYIYSKGNDGREQIIIAGPDELRAAPRPIQDLAIMSYFVFLEELERIKDEAIHAAQHGIYDLTEGKIRQMLDALQVALSSESDSDTTN